MPITRKPQKRVIPPLARPHIEYAKALNRVARRLRETAKESELRSLEKNSKALRGLAKKTREEIQTGREISRSYIKHAKIEIYKQNPTGKGKRGKY
ncbi:MAG: hypothetical protein HY392_03940 [Candidatus Diapherotrites archaeon]|nr:hypothetical protein [Candidatus Diapherotrites archaeon]